MDTKERKRIVAATLKWCNERRKEKGLKPLDDLPKGFMSEGTSCPCGTACGYYVGYFDYWEVIMDSAGVPSNNQTLYSQRTSLGKIPAEVNRFTMAFDDGEFPEYQKED